jgi:plastocyanin
MSKTAPPQRARRAPAARRRGVAFAAVVVVVLALGGFLAFGKLVNRPADAPAPGAVNVQSSMAGFTPTEIRVKAGTTATITWWTDDSALHLQNGVHTMIAPALGLNEALPGASRRTFTWSVPNKPGTYDVYCDTCCGGKAAPSMHGKIVVEPTA